MENLELQVVEQIKRFLIAISSLYKQETNEILEDITNHQYESFHAFVDKYYFQVAYSEELVNFVRDLVSNNLLPTTFLDLVKPATETNEKESIYPIIEEISARPIKVLLGTIKGVKNSCSLTSLSNVQPALTTNFFKEEAKEPKEEATLLNFSSNLSASIEKPHYAEINVEETMDIPTINLYNPQLEKEPNPFQTGVFVPIEPPVGPEKMEKKETTFDENAKETIKIEEPVKTEPEFVPNFTEVKIDELPKPENKSVPLPPPPPIYTFKPLEPKEEMVTFPLPTLEANTTDDTYEEIKEEDKKRLEEETKEKLKQTILETQLNYLENASNYIQTLETEQAEEIYNSLLTLNDIRYIYHCISKLSDDALNKLLAYIEESLKEKKNNAINIFIEEAIKRTLHAKPNEKTETYEKRRSA